MSEKYTSLTVKEEQVALMISMCFCGEVRGERRSAFDRCFACVARDALLEAKTEISMSQRFPRFTMQTVLATAVYDRYPQDELTAQEFADVFENRHVLYPQLDEGDGHGDFGYYPGFVLGFEQDSKAIVATMDGRTLRFRLTQIRADVRFSEDPNVTIKGTKSRPWGIPIKAPPTPEPDYENYNPVGPGRGQCAGIDGDTRFESGRYFSGENDFDNELRRRAGIAPKPYDVHGPYPRPSPFRYYREALARGHGKPKLPATRPADAPAPALPAWWYAGVNPESLPDIQPDQSTRGRPGRPGKPLT